MDSIERFRERLARKDADNERLRDALAELGRGLCCRECGVNYMTPQPPHADTCKTGEALALLTTETPTLHILKFEGE